MLITPIHTTKYKTDSPLTKKNVSNGKIAFEGGRNAASKISEAITKQANIDLLKYFIKTGSDSVKFDESMISHYKSSIDYTSESLKDLEFEKLPEYIEFIEAKTLGEAKNFVKNVLKINDYNVYDLSIANIVNEGMVKVNNLAKGKCPMPMSVSLKPLANKDAQDIDELFNNRTIAQVQNGHLTLNQFLFNEKVIAKSELLRSACHEMGHLLDTNNILTKGYNQGLISDKNNCSALEKKVIILKNEIEENEKKLEAIINPPKKTIQDKLSLYINGILNKKPKTATAEETIINTSKQLTEEISIPKDVNIIQLRLEQWGEDEKRIAKKVSYYATVSGKEFIAETFSMLCTKGIKSCSEDVIGLYKKLEGPMLEGFTN